MNIENGNRVSPNPAGQRHREDGPAIESANGDKEWRVNGKPFRENGPTVPELTDSVHSLSLVSLFEQDPSSWKAERWILEHEKKLCSVSQQNVSFSPKWNENMSAYGQAWSSFRKHCGPSGPKVQRVRRSLTEQLMDENVYELIVQCSEKTKSALESASLVTVAQLVDQFRSFPLENRFGRFCFELRKRHVPEVSYFRIAILALFASILVPEDDRNDKKYL